MIAYILLAVFGITVLAIVLSMAYGTFKLYQLLINRHGLYKIFSSADMLLGFILVWLVALVICCISVWFLITLVQRMV